MGRLKRLWARVVLAAAFFAAPGAWAKDKDAVSSADPALVQDYEPNPAIWLLEDEDTRIYLFGTFHLLPRGFRWRTTQFDAIVDEVDELVLETSGEESESSMRDLMLPMIAKPNRPKVSERLSPASAKKWLSLIAQTGMPADTIDTMPLVLSGFMFGLSGLGDGGRSYRDNGVETVLEREFKAAGKPIGSIEDAGDVMRSLLAIDDTLLIRQLEKQLMQLEGASLAAALGAFGQPGEEGPFAMEHAWARGELALEPMFDSTTAGRAMHKALLADRNRAWAQWLDERLDRPGTVLLAVGAAHFEGRDSVFDYLAERGLEAARLN